MHHKTDLIACPKCGGQGRVEERPFSTYGPDATADTECGMCRGYGTIFVRSEYDYASVADAVGECEEPSE